MCAGVVKRELADRIALEAMSLGSSSLPARTNLSIQDQLNRIKGEKTSLCKSVSHHRYKWASVRELLWNQYAVYLTHSTVRVLNLNYCIGKLLPNLYIQRQ